MNYFDDRDSWTTEDFNKWFNANKKNPIKILVKSTCIQPGTKFVDMLLDLCRDVDIRIILPEDEDENLRVCLGIYEIYTDTGRYLSHNWVGRFDIERKPDCCYIDSFKYDCAYTDNIKEAKELLQYATRSYLVKEGRIRYKMGALMGNWDEAA